LTGIQTLMLDYLLIYNSGSPFIAVTTDRTTINNTTEFTLGRAWTDGTTTHSITSGTNLYNHVNQNHERVIEVRGFERASGGVISETGILNIASTAGVFYLGSNRITTTAQDTNDNDVFFTSWYRNGSGGWTKVVDQNQIDNVYYDDGTGVLNDLTSNRYGVHWVFVHFDSDLQVVYGRDDYKLTDAENAFLPSDLPEAVNEFGTIAAKIIIQKNAVVFTSIASAYTTLFPVSSPIVHNDLSGLQGGTAGEYYHLTNYLNELINDFNNAVENATDKWTTENINTQGTYDFDSNSFNIDINLGGNNIINANDINATNLFIETGDLNLFVYDKNIVMQTANGGTISFFPDLNKTCIGNTPDKRVCYWLSCGVSDCNGVFGIS